MNLDLQNLFFTHFLLLIKSNQKGTTKRREKKGVGQLIDLGEKQKQLKERNLKKVKLHKENSTDGSFPSLFVSFGLLRLFPKKTQRKMREKEWVRGTEQRKFMRQQCFSLSVGGH